MPTLRFDSPAAASRSAVASRLLVLALAASVVATACGQGVGVARTEALATPSIGAEAVAPVTEPAAASTPVRPASAALVPAPAPPAPAVETVAALAPGRFGYAAKGMTHEVMAFVTYSQLQWAIDHLDLSAVSTIAYFSLDAGSYGAIRTGAKLDAWRSYLMTRLVAKAHAAGTRVVASLSRFAWSSSQASIARSVLTSSSRRQTLARNVVNEVVRRGVDGVNVDFEPIPTGYKSQFTDLVRRIRAELDARGPNYQLTFDVVGHYGSWDVGGALRAGADAVFLMGYHYAGTWSTQAVSTAPMGGARYDVADTVRNLLLVAKPSQLIMGVPYYGHVWPTSTSSLGSRTRGGGYDITYDKAKALIARLGRSSYDSVQQVRWSAWHTTSGWWQVYFDDARASAYKWAFVKARGLRGTGMWTAAFEGSRRELTNALRAAFLAPSS